MIDNIIFTANTVAPVFIIIALGYFSKKINVINENFVDITSKFVFNISLPAFIFLKIYDIDLHKVIILDLLIYIYSATVIVFILLLIFSAPFIKNGRDRGSFIQGAFRGNFAIIGLAIISNLFGREALAESTVILAFVIPLYNILSVIAIVVPLHSERKMNIRSTILEIFFNPLVLAVIVGLPFSYFRLKLPDLAKLTGSFLSDLALPMALIGIGGSLNFHNIRKASGLAFSSSFLKLAILPALMTFGAYLSGFRQTDLGIMFILFACPTAIVSFIMAETMGANSRLAGNIVLVSTITSILSISAGIILLKSISLI